MKAEIRRARQQTYPGQISSVGSGPPFYTPRLDWALIAATTDPTHEHRYGLKHSRTKTQSASILPRRVCSLRKSAVTGGE
jgi:hypothetical protein